TALYSAMANSDQVDPSSTYSDLNGLPAGSLRLGNMVAMTEVPTNVKPTWSVKPPVLYQATATNLRVEMFRHAVRLVDGNNLFPTGVVTNPYCTGIPLGITVTTENPVYIFGNYN